MLAFVSAAVSLCWTLSGTVLLDALGGPSERLARDRSATAPALGILVILVKVVAGLLALALVRGARLRRCLLPTPIVLGRLILVRYGEVEVLVGGLVLADVINPFGPGR